MTSDRLLPAFLRLCLVFVLALGAGACSSTSEEDIIALEMEKPPVTRIDLTTGEEVEEMTPEKEMAMRYGSVMQDKAAPSADQVDVLEMSDRSSNTNVDVFSLERPGQRAAPGAVKLMDDSNAGGVYSASPGVQIFPLDDAMGELIGTHLKPEDQNIEISPPESANMPQPHSSLEGKPEGVNIAKKSMAGQTESVVMRIYFPHDAVSPSAKAVKGLKDMVAQIGDKADFGLSIEGHSSMRADIDDPVKRRIINLKVSMDRSFSVARELIAAGIPAKSLYVVGLGDSYPSLPVDGLSAEAASRRVEIIPVFRQ